MKWDFFVCHASDDKPAFVDELVSELSRRGFRIWYDEFCLKPGDSLRRSIDLGLSESAAGVVVLSKNFFAKEWPQKELDALTAQQVGAGKRVIPVWYDIDAAYVRSVSPLLADIVAIPGDKGARTVALRISSSIGETGRYTSQHLERLVEEMMQSTDNQAPLLGHRIVENFRRLMNYFMEYDRLIESVVENNEFTTDEQLATAAESVTAAWQKDAIRVLRIPETVYLAPTRSLDPCDRQSIEERLCDWIVGCLSLRETAELLYDLDEWLDADYLYVFFDVPNFELTPEQRNNLLDAVFRIGTRKAAAIGQPWRKAYDEVFLNGGRRREDG